MRLDETGNSWREFGDVRREKGGAAKTSWPGIAESPHIDFKWISGFVPDRRGLNAYL